MICWLDDIPFDGVEIARAGPGIYRLCPGSVRIFSLHLTVFCKLTLVPSSSPLFPAEDSSDQRRCLVGFSFRSAAVVFGFYYPPPFPRPFSPPQTTTPKPDHISTIFHFLRLTKVLSPMMEFGKGEFSLYHIKGFFTV